MSTPQDIDVSSNVVFHSIDAVEGSITDLSGSIIEYDVGDITSLSGNSIVYNTATLTDLTVPSLSPVQWVGTDLTKKLVSRSLSA